MFRFVECIDFLELFFFSLMKSKYNLLKNQLFYLSDFAWFRNLQRSQEMRDATTIIFSPVFYTVLIITTGF